MKMFFVSSYKYSLHWDNDSFKCHSSEMPSHYQRPSVSLTSMEVDANSQRGARHRHQGVRFVCRVQWNSSDSLVNRVKQEGAHTCSETVQSPFVFRTHCIPTVYVTVAVKRCLTFTGLLSCLEAVSSGAHAGPGCWWGGQTQLGAVSIVVTTQIDTR